MANTFLTASIIAKEALNVIKNSMPFTKSVYKDYTSESPGNVNGFKVGQAVNIAVPPRFIVASGPNLALQDITEPTKQITLTQQKHVDVTFSSVDLTLNIARFSELVVVPAVAALGNQVEYDGLQLAKRVYNTIGTPGTPIASVPPFLQANALLNDNSAPMDGNRTALLTPYGEANVVGSALGYFNAQTQVAAQYEDGMMGRFAGFTAKMSQNLPTFTGGALGGAPRVNGAAQGIVVGYAETGTLVTNGWTASVAGIMNAGDVFTIPGVYAVNVQNRTPLARLQQFVVLTTATSDGAGNATLSIAPAIITGGPFQNVSTAPANAAVVTPLSAAGVVSPQFLAYHKSAFAFVSRPLEMPGGLDFAAVETDKDTGISIRVVRQYAIGTDTFPMRMDILYGWRELYPEFAVRLAN